MGTERESRSVPAMGCPYLPRFCANGVDDEGITEERLRELRRSPVAFHVLINPTVSVIENREICFFEACLSFSGYMGAVPRAAVVQVDALNELGEPTTIRAEGWYARILQHEIDHLSGVIYNDKILPHSLMTAENYRTHWSTKTAAEIADAFGRRC